MIRLMVGAAALLLVSWASGASGRKKVGIILWNGVHEPRYIAGKDGILEGLRDEGFKESDLEIMIEDASGEKARVQRIIDKFKAANVDVFVPVGTSAAVPVAQAVRDRPVVFSLVFDPVASGIVRDWNSSGNNVTGGATLIWVPDFLRRLVKLSRQSKDADQIERMAIVFTPGEKNTEIQKDAMLESGRELNIPVTVLPVVNAHDVDAMFDRFHEGPGLLYLTGSSVLSKKAAQVIRVATQRKIMTATTIEDFVQPGALFALIPDQKTIGRRSGRLLAKVLRGTPPASIPIGLPTPKFRINEQTAKSGRFRIAPALREWAAGTLQ